MPNERPPVRTVFNAHWAWGYAPTSRGQVGVACCRPATAYRTVREAVWASLQQCFPGGEAYSADFVCLPCVQAEVEAQRMKQDVLAAVRQAFGLHPPQMIYWGRIIGASNSGGVLFGHIFFSLKNTTPQSVHFSIISGFAFFFASIFGR